MAQRSEVSAATLASDVSVSSSDQQHVARYNYCCVECLTPTPTLYKIYTAHSSVKLTRCANCGNDVDPFVEREALLVSFDLILHRIAAYRHTIFNRHPFADFDIAASVGRCFKFSLGTSILDAYIKYEALRFRLYTGGRDKSAVVAEDFDPSIFFRLLAMSFLEQMLLLIGTIVVMLPLLDEVMRTYYVSRLSLAIVLPCTFKSVTIFVHIWENSPTTRILGAIFVASMQWMSVHTVVERILTMSKGKSVLQRVYTSIPGSLLIAGLLLRLLVPILVGMLLRMDDILNQCSGVDIGVELGSLRRNICIL